LGNVKRFKLFDGVIIIGNLWESELLLINVHGVDREFWLLESTFLNLILKFDSSIEVLLVKRYTERIDFLLHFTKLFSVLFLLNFFLFGNLSFLFRGFLGSFGFFLGGNCFFFSGDLFFLFRLYLSFLLSFSLSFGLSFSFNFLFSFGFDCGFLGFLNFCLSGSERNFLFIFLIC